MSMSASFLARFAIAFAVVAAPAAAAPVPVASTATNQADAVDPAAIGGGNSAPDVKAEKKICRQLDSSYSRMTQRVCLTRQEWQRVEAAAR